MISSIRLRNFKNFTDFIIGLSGCTLLMGQNGSGKSSIIQALLSLIQSQDGEGRIPALILNGDLCRLGVGRDAFNRHSDAEAETIDFMFDYDRDGESHQDSLSFRYEPDADVLYSHSDPDQQILAVDRGALKYLSADRVGPRLMHPYSHTDAAQSMIGNEGGGALGVLLARGKDTLAENDQRIPEGVGERSIEAIFNAYLSEISPGANIDVAGYVNIDSVAATFSFRKEGQLSTEDIRPTNVGFGLSYATAVVLNCLIAEVGDILVIENPEAHLHTKAQRAIADLLMRTTAVGVQIIVETHSREIFYHMRQKVQSGEFESSDFSMQYVPEDLDKDTIINCPCLSPINAPMASLGDAHDEFLSGFGAPMDFVNPNA